MEQREPYGRWGGRRAWKPDGYTGTSGGDWNSIYDIALIEVGKRDRTLQEAVGAFTPMLNQGGKHTIATTGYPGLLGSKAIKWNFTKFLVGRDGKVLKRYAPTDKPESLTSDIEAALAA